MVHPELSPESTAAADVAASASPVGLDGPLALGIATISHLH